MKKGTKQLLLTITGYFFLLLGVIGAVLPVLQGWLFFLIGLSILARTTPWARRFLHKLRERFPKLAKKTDKWLDKWK